MGHSISSKNQLNVCHKVWNLECYVSMAEILRPKKKAKATDLSTITLGYVYTRPGSFLEQNKRKLKSYLTQDVVQL